MPLLIYLWKSMEILLMLVWFWFCTWVKGYTQPVTWSTVCVRYSKGKALQVVTSCPLLLLHDSKIMQPLIKPTVRRHLRTSQGLVDTLSHKADGFLYRTFQSFLQSTNTIRGSRPVCNPEWHAVQTWSSLVSSVGSRIQPPTATMPPEPGSLTFLVGNPKHKTFICHCYIFLLPLTFPSRSI